jgi:hypothetical protein
MRRWILIILWMGLSLFSGMAQDASPSIPVGLSDPYLMFVPVGWRAESPNPFGFTTIGNDDIRLNVLDPIRFEQFIPHTPDTSPRQLLIDYSQFFYVETLTRQQIELLTIGENTVALYRDPTLPALATYVVELANHRFALIEVEAYDGTFDSTEEPTVHAILGTLTISSAQEIRNDVLYDTVSLPSERYSLSLPPNWHIEPSFVPGQLFLVGDGIEIIFFPPDSLSGYFAFSEDVNLVDLAQVIETEFFQIDLRSITLTSAQAGDRHLVAYGFRSTNTATDTQALLVQLPDGEVGYFKVVAPQGQITQLLQDRIRRIALSLKANTQDNFTDGLFEDDIGAILIPRSGQWRIELRDMMRVVCDGTIERLIPISQEIQAVFGDFDTLVADPNGDSITIASDGVVNLFQSGTLQRDNTRYYEIRDAGRNYILTPINQNSMTGRLNLITPNETSDDCRVGVSMTLRYIE